MTNSDAILSSWSMMKSYARTHPINAASMVFLAVAYPIESVLFPVFIGRLTKDVVNHKPRNVIMKDLAILASLNAISLFLYTLDMFASQAFQVGIQTHVQRKLTEYLFLSRGEGTDTLPTTELAVKMRAYAALMSSRINMLRNNFVPGLFSLCFQSVYLMAKIDIVLGLLVLAVAGCILLALVYALNTRARAAAVSIVAEENSIAYISDILENFTTVVGNDCEKKEVANLEVLHDRARRARMNAVTKSFTVTAAVNAAAAAIAVVFFWRLLRRYLSPERNESQGEKANVAATASAMALEVLGNTRSLMHHMYTLYHSSSGLCVIRGYFEPPPPCPKMSPCLDAANEASVDGVEALDATPARNAMEIARVGFAYPNSAPVFKNLSIAFPEGTKTAVVGKNGAGKSTLLKLLTRIALPATGEILLFGSLYSRLSAKEVRAKVAFATQTPVLFNRTVLDNIRYAHPETSIQDVKRFTSNLGLGDFFTDALLLKKAGRNGTELSGGQRQLVQLCRIAFQGTPIVIVDEITAAVDSKHRELIVRMIRNGFAGKTLIAVTHDDEIIGACDRVVRLTKTPAVPE